LVFLATDVLGLQPGNLQVDIVYSQCYKLHFVKAKTQMAKKKQRSPSIVEARVYRGLKTAIMAGGFKPGAVLVQEELCKQFRASRTPIRDALTHLQAEGLVVAIPNKGVVVRDFSPKDVHDIYEIRALLESAAVQDAAGKIPKASLEAIINKASALSSEKNFAFDQVKELGTELHRLIIDASGNLIMQDLLNRMETLIEISRIPFRQAHERLKEINQEHIDIARALLKGDGDSAAELMRNHFILTKEAHLKILLGSGYRTHRAVNQR